MSKNDGLSLIKALNHVMFDVNFLSSMWDKFMGFLAGLWVFWQTEFNIILDAVEGSGLRPSLIPRWIQMF